MMTVPAFKARKGSPEPLVVLTAWTDAAAPDDPLTRALGASARTAHLSLQPLSESQEADLATAHIGFRTVLRAP